MWQHKQFKNKRFFMNYIRTKAGKFQVVFEDASNGKNVKKYPSYQAATKDGWVKIS